MRIQILTMAVVCAAGCCLARSATEQYVDVEIAQATNAVTSRLGGEISAATNGLETAAHAASTYQPTIGDLDTIRSGAAAGFTAVQPAAISDMETRTHAADTYQPQGNYLTAESDPTVAATNITFSNAVLAVGLNIDTNSVAQLNAILNDIGGVPIEGTATTVGGLLLALAAAVAWLKKNKLGRTDSIQPSQVTGLETALAGKRDKNDFSINPEIKDEYLPITGGSYDWSSHRLEKQDDGSYYLYAASGGYAAIFNADGTLNSADQIYFNGASAYSLYGEELLAIDDYIARESQLETKANKSDFTIGSFAAYVSALFSSANTSLTARINELIEDKVGNINDALDALNGEVA